MRKFLNIALLLLIALAPLPAGVFAQNNPTLVPFNDDAFGIQGLIPEGWASAGMGIHARQSSASDTALLILQSTPMRIDALWPVLLPQFGLGAVPETQGTRANGTFSWTLYQFDVTVGSTTARIDTALAEQDGTTYIALLQTSPDEYDSLHEAVFLPVLDSLTVTEEAPVPYVVEEVSFSDGDVSLAGTLTLPQTPGPHPAVALMTGTGPQTRNEIVVPGFPIFRQIADYLTRQGIAVLRYDDRGVGQSTGNYNATSIYDFAADGQAAVDYLKTRSDINPDQVGLLGHSEGGVYAAILGAKPDNGLAFIISIAGTAVDGRDLLLRQDELLLKAGGASADAVQSQLDYLHALFPLVAERNWDAVGELTRQHALDQWESLSAAQRNQTGAADAGTYAQHSADGFLANYDNESFVTFLEYNPAVDWAKTTVPVLAIFGSLDLQVDAEQNAGPMREALTQAGNPDFSIVTIDGANHLFQAAETGTLAEYLQLPLEFTPEFLPTIRDWLLARVDVPG